MPPIPAPALVVVQPTRTRGVLVELLDRPAAVRQLDEPLQRRVCGQIAVIPLHVAMFAWPRPLPEQPAFRPSRDAVMARGELRAACGPVHPDGHKLFPQGHVIVLAPGDGLPAFRRQARQDGLGLIEGRRASLLGLAAAPGARGRYQRCRLHLLGEAPPKSAAHADHIRHLPVVEPLHEGGIVAVARVGDDPGSPTVSTDLRGIGLSRPGSKVTGIFLRHL